MRTAKIPETVFELGLSPAAMAIYGVLLLHRNKATGTAWPSRETMLKLSGVSVNRITARLQELIAHGLIQRIRKRPNNVNEYAVFFPNQNHKTVTLTSKPESQKCDSAYETRTTEVCLPESQECDSGPHKIETGTNERNHRKEPTIVRGQKNGHAQVEELYRLYPRKRDKKRALSAIRSALKEADFDTLKKAVLDYAKERKGQDQKFTKHPATWFNGECWNNEPEKQDLYSGRFKTCSEGRD
jgi:hypothetical protein